MASNSRITMGERDSALSTRICPRSMRLAISTSPSRVSKRHGAHLAQIHADGIVGLFQSAGGEVEFDVLALLGFVEFFIERGGRQLGAFQHVDALRADRGQQVVEVFGTDARHAG